MKSFLFWFFQALSLPLSRWCIRLNSKGWAQGPNSCAYIGILPSRMHLSAITTHYWLLQFFIGHYHPLTTIQNGFQNWWALQNFKMLWPWIITMCTCGGVHGWMMHAWVFLGIAVGVAHMHVFRKSCWRNPLGYLTSSDDGIRVPPTRMA